MEAHDFWQDFLPRSDRPHPPFTDRFPADLPDGRVLLLPIRPLADTGTAIASMILNQASFAVEAAMADHLAARLAQARIDMVVGMPTLGLTLARAVAERLGHTRFVPLGTSRKFWYRQDWSVPLASITSPDASKRLYMDPRMMPLIAGRRVALIDDVFSSGTSICAGLALLALVGVTPVALGTAMVQTRRWHARLADVFPGMENRVHHVIETPMLSASGSGWVPQTA